MKCPDCGAELESDVDFCPYCSKPVARESRSHRFLRRREYQGVRHQQGRVLVDDDSDEEVTIRTEGHERLRAGDSVDVRGFGARMDGAYRVSSVRHRIAASNETEEEIRCPKCRAMNDGKGKFCRKCGTRLPS